MASSAVSVPTYQAVNANIANDGSADSPRGFGNVTTTGSFSVTKEGPSLYRVEVSSPAAPITATLPTDVKAGYRVRFEVELTSSTETNCFFTSPSIADAQINGAGFVELMAKIDNPSAAADWKVVGVEENQATSLTLSPVTGAHVGCTVALTGFFRSNKSVTAHFSSTSVTAASASSSATTVTIPSRIRPTSSRAVTITQERATVGITMSIGTDGILTAYRVDGTNWGAVTSRFFGLGGQTVTYSL